jgi:hypothetical protein
MRTTIQLDDDLLAELKVLAAKGTRTVSEVIEDAVRHSLSQRVRTGARPVDLPVSRQTGGTRPGVGLDNSAALLDTMETRQGRKP